MAAWRTALLVGAAVIAILALSCGGGTDLSGPLEGEALTEACELAAEYARVTQPHVDARWICDSRPLELSRRVVRVYAYHASNDGGSVRTTIWVRVHGNGSTEDAGQSESVRGPAYQSSRLAGRQETSISQDVYERSTCQEEAATDRLWTSGTKIRIERFGIVECDGWLLVSDGSDETWVHRDDTNYATPTPTPTQRVTPPNRSDGIHAWVDGIKMSCAYFRQPGTITEAMRRYGATRSQIVKGISLCVDALSRQSR